MTTNRILALVETTPDKIKADIFQLAEGLSEITEEKRQPLLEKLSILLSNVQSLDLSSLRKSHCVLAIVNLLQTNTSITYLNLRSTGTDDKGAIVIAQMLRKNKTLLKLALDDNPISAKGFHAIANALRANNSLRHFKYHGESEHKHMMDSNGAKGFASMLKVNRSLRVLDIAYNNIGNEGTVALAETLCSIETTLKSLNLSGNRLGKAATVSLSKMLETNTHLKALNLNSNLFGAEGLQELAPGVVENQHLQTLSLSSCCLKDDSAPHISTMMESKSLTSLDVSHNEMTNKGLLSFIVALNRNVTLLSFSSMNENATECIYALLESQLTRNFLLAMPLPQTIKTTPRIMNLMAEYIGTSTAQQTPENAANDSSKSLTLSR